MLSITKKFRSESCCLMYLATSYFSCTFCLVISERRAFWNDLLAARLVKRVIRTAELMSTFAKSISSTVCKN